MATYLSNKYSFYEQNKNIKEILFIAGEKNHKLTTIKSYLLFRQRR